MQATKKRSSAESIHVSVGDKYARQPATAATKFWDKQYTMINFFKGAIQVLRYQVFDFFDPPTHLFDDLQYYKSSKIAIF